jgi:hypothetical protein
LFEPASTLNTGNVRNERTVERLEKRSSWVTLTATAFVVTVLTAVAFGIFLVYLISQTGVGKPRAPMASWRARSWKDAARSCRLGEAL